VPQELAGRITRAIASATIGIGAGPETDGQVLVVNDLAGVTIRDFKHNRRYGQVGAALRDSVRAYAAEVRSGAFPGPEHGFHMADEERAAFEAWLRSHG
jgi:3-methyl-2-oxobutanoate hydroxymethyltransferase